MTKERSGVPYLAALARRHFAALICIACCAPLLLFHFDELWRFRHSRYLPLAAIGFCILVWKCRSHELSPLPISRVWDRCCMVFAAVALVAAILMTQPFLAGISAALICGTILLRLRREGEIERFIPIWMFLIFVIQLPEQWNLRILHLLQTYSTQWASLLIDVMNITHSRIGNIIWVNGKQYFTQQAFNGLPFLFSVITITGWWAILKRRRLVHASFLLLSAVFWCVALNTLWMVLVVYCQQRLNFDLHENPLNQVTRIAVLGAVIGMLFFSDLALSNYPNATRWVMMGGLEISDEQLIGLRIKRRDMFELLMLSTFGLLLILQASGMRSDNLQLSGYSKDKLITFQSKDLPAELDGWQCGDFEFEQRADGDIRGLRHAQWQYQHADRTVYVSVDFPFHIWHNDQASFSAAGITIDNAQMLDSEAFPETVTIHDVSMTDGSRGQLIATMLGQNGRIPPWPNTNSRRGFMRGDAFELASSSRALQHPGYQIRVLETSTKFTEVDHDELRQLHAEVSRLIRAAIGSKGKAPQ